MTFTLLVGWIVDHFSYAPVYIMVGCMAPLAAVLFLLIMRRIERVAPAKA
jgi:sugar phosphate permease